MLIGAIIPAMSPNVVTGNEDLTSGTSNTDPDRTAYILVNPIVQDFDNDGHADDVKLFAHYEGTIKPVTNFIINLDGVNYTTNDRGVVYVGNLSVGEHKFHFRKHIGSNIISHNAFPIFAPEPMEIKYEIDIPTEHLTESFIFKPKLMNEMYIFLKRKILKKIDRTMNKCKNDLKCENKGINDINPH